MSFPTGAHDVEVEIDRDTGQASLARSTGVDDYGVLVNPLIAAGQAHGVIAQGVGKVLLEHAVYDPVSGRLLARSFIDYALPRVDDLPSSTSASTARGARPTARRQKLRRCRFRRPRHPGTDLAGDE